ncbi:DUF5958 family protein [Streptomyces ambofaciens]
MFLNELAQGLRPTAEGVEWFEGLPEGDQRKVLHALGPVFKDHRVVDHV